MFTGIIEELGTVSHIKTNSQSLEMTILAKDILKDIKQGDSIAVNGACLTVTSFNDRQFSVDIMPETYQATSLAKAKIGDLINLESSLRFNGKLGGHFVTGHVDDIGTIEEIMPADNAINYKIRINKDLIKYCIYKGSVAIDGASLTIFGVGKNWLKISLIPHTVKNSVIGNKKVGDIVNVECDMLGKYVLNLALANPVLPTSNITQDILAKNGFI